MSVLTKIWVTVMMVSVTIYCIGMFAGLAWDSVFFLALVGIIGFVVSLAIGFLVALWRDAI